MSVEEILRLITQPGFGEEEEEMLIDEVLWREENEVVTFCHGLKQDKINNELST